MKYIIKEREEVFHPEFLEYLQGVELTKHNLQLLMNRIAEYEAKTGLEFVSSDSDLGVVIFREV